VVIIEEGWKPWRGYRLHRVQQQHSCALCYVLVMYCKFLNTWTNSQTSVMYQFQSLELLCMVIFYPTNKGFIRYWQARQIVGKTKDQSHLDDLLKYA